MNKIARFQFNFCCSFSRVSRYSLTALLGVVLLSDVVGAKVGGLQNYSPKRSPELLLDKYRDNLPSLADGDKQVLLRRYQNQQQIYIAQQPASTPSIPLNAEQQKLYQQGVKLVQQGQELRKKGTREASEQAIKKYKQALKIAQELGLRQEEALIYQFIGAAYGIRSENIEALEYFKQSLNISRELKQPLLQVLALTGIAGSYTFIGKGREALTFLKQAESIARTEKRFDIVVVVLKGISNAHKELGEIQKTIEPLNQAMQIYRDILKDVPGQAEVLNIIGTNYSSISQPKIALKYYEQALEIQQTRQDLLPAQANTLRDIGTLYKNSNEYDKALEYLNKARKIQQAQSLLVDEGLTLQSIAEVYKSRGDYQKSIEISQQAIVLFKKSGNTALEAINAISIANIYKNFLGNHQKALEFVNEAIQLSKNIGYELTHATALNEKAYIYALQGDFQQALEIYSQALEVAISIKNRNLEARTLTNIAYTYGLLGNYDLSIQTYSKVRQIYQELQDSQYELITLSAMSELYLTKGDYPEAINYYNQSVSLSREQNNNQFERLGLQGLARSYELQKDFPNALKNAETALSLSQKFEDKYLEAGILNVIGIINRAKGNYGQALTYHQKALSQYRKMGATRLEAQSLSNISVTYSFQKQYQQAIDILTQEIKLRRTLKDRTGEADAFYLIAINQRNRGNLEAALPNIQAAINIVESIRGKVQSDELRTSYFATVQNYYKFYIDLLMQLHEKDPTKVCEFNIQDLKIKDRCDAVALHISERARARSLVELLTEANAKIRKGANPELIQQERDLLQKLDTKQKLLQDLESRNQKNPVTEASIKRCQQDIENLLSQYRELQTKIRTTSPKYADLKYPEPLKLDQIQQQLDKDTILLQYSLGEQHSYVWVVTPNSLHSYELPKRKLIETAALDLKARLQDIANQGTSPDNIPLAGKKISITQAASQLSKLILAPVTKHLGQKRLVVVPDGVLQYIPFAALTIPQSSISQNNYQPLLLNHEIVNLPSASTIDILRKEIKERKAPKTLAVLADPVFSKQDERLANNCQNPQPFLSNNDQQLARKPQNSSYNIELDLEKSALIRATRDVNWDNITRLKKTRTEALEIMKFVDDSEQIHAFDCDANYAWVSNPELSQYRYLLFATHGILNDINPELSGIVLSLVDKNGNPTQKPFLQLSDLFNLDYPAELIVLSACETGLGKEVSGEGLVGLTRGLMYAGAARVAVSLWSVEDEATSKLMREFYREILQNGKTPAAALRAAQLEMWRQEEWRNPYSWAGFTLLGEWR